MYTAEEARKKAEQCISDETKKQLSWTEKCISAAVDKGEMGCWFGERLNKQSIGKLKEFGYKVVDRSNQRDGMAYEISWEKQ